MPSSPDRTALTRRRRHVRRLRAAFERLAGLPRARRVAAARREFGSDPALLRDLVALFEAPEPTDSFLTPPSVRTEQLGAAVEPGLGEGAVLAHRWRLDRRIGSGGQGVVWEARDLVRGGSAAVKLLRRVAGSEAVHRESAALRWLSVPGVVRLFDEGEEEGVVWLAMELVRGTPFPGRGRGTAWADVEPLALGLLETLARVHGAGVVHGDLKPQNVLVDAQGLVTVLDLGLAAALGAGGLRPFGGTPGYAAPERFQGAQPDVRSDLYSAGVLFCRALGGGRPDDQGRCRVPRRGVPRHVRRVLERMMAADPGRRPASAAETILLLGPGSAAPRSRPWTVRELRARFDGHDAFLHLPEDAARELHRRTGGDPALVESEVASWMRAGLARLEAGRVVTDRFALVRIAAMPLAAGRRAPRTRVTRLARLDAALTLALRSGEPRAVVRAAVAVAEAALAEGHALHALSALEFGIAAGERAGDRRGLRHVQLLAARAALLTATAREIERAIWLLRRGASRDEHAGALRDVLLAAASLQAGDRESARRLAAGATRRAPTAVLPIAWSVRVLVAQSLDLASHRREVEAGIRALRRQRTPQARRARRTWRAWLEYRVGRCAAAARLHLRNARHAPGAEERLRSLLDAAVAALDAGDLRTAVGMARLARRRAASLRLPVREARAWFLERDALARSGTPLRPDLEGLAAADALGFAVLSWNARMCECAIAWRAGDTARAREILAPLPTGGDVSALALHQIPVACAAVALGAPAGRDRVRALARRAMREAAPTLAVQCLALLASGAPAARPSLRRTLSRLRLPASADERRRGREFFSVQEAVDVLTRD